MGAPKPREAPERSDQCRSQPRDGRASDFSNPPAGFLFVSIGGKPELPSNLSSLLSRLLKIPGKDGMYAGASDPCYEDNERSVTSCTFARREHKSGAAVISAHSCQRDPSGFISKSRTQGGDVTPHSFPVSSATPFHLLKPRAENSLPSFVPICVPIHTSTSCLFVISPSLI